MLDATDKQKEQLRALGDVEAAINGFARLIEDFRDRLGSADVDSLLQDFDRVVTEILCPENEDEQVESVLLESYRLENEVGAEAVIELLKGLSNGNPRLRERYVDALANAEKWSEVVKTIRHVERSHLSRRELEHGLFACAKTAVFDWANDMMKQHQNEYDDNAARLFRRELSRQYPEIGTDAPGGMP